MNDTPENNRIKDTPPLPAERTVNLRAVGKIDATRTTDVIRADDFYDPEEADAEDDSAEAEPSSRDHIIGAVIGAVKGIVYITAVIVIGVALAFFFVIPVGNDIFALVKEEEIIDITIPEMATLNDVAEILYDNGLISYPGIFKLYCNFTENKNDEFYGVYLAGDYSLSTTLNYSQLLGALKPSSEIEILSITIPEGLTTDEIIDLFVDEYGIGTHDGFIAAINDYDWSEDYDFWFVDELEETGWSEYRYYRLDGYLYPDTYYFYSDSSEVEAIAKLLANFEAKFSETYRSYVESKGMTVDEAIILASMVQAEARYLSEFSYVSSVFHNRLDNSDSYPYLESDATIMYAIAHTEGERPESLSGTEYDSPYNTYKYRGLPPGPICNPGLDAIRYAIYPRSTDYFYFVANTDGYSVFSSTLAEHEQAIENIRNGTAISTIFLGNSGGEYQEDDD